MPRLSDAEKLSEAMRALKLIADTCAQNEQHWPAAVARDAFDRIFAENNAEGELTE